MISSFLRNKPNKSLQSSRCLTVTKKRNGETSASRPFPLLYIHTFYNNRIDVQSFYDRIAKQNRLHTERK